MGNISPKMGLTIPVPTQEPGPDYAEQVSDDLLVIDGHTHLGDGLTGSQLSQDSLNITGDLSLNQTNNLTNARSIIFTDQTVSPDGVGDIRSTYFLNGDFWINNGTGAPVQITAGGSVDVTAANTIYGAQLVGANWTIVSTDTYVLLQVDSSASRTVTLPTAASVSDGRYYIIADVTGLAATHPITINKAGSDTIDGASSHKIYSNFGCAIVMGDGLSEWKVLDQFNVQQGGLVLGSAIALSARNAAGSANLNIAATDGSDNLILGDASNPKISVAAPSLTFTAGVTPGIKQDVSVSGAGRNLTIQAQGGASGTNNGADVIVEGGNRGNGSAAYGGVQLATGDGTAQLKVSTSAAKFNLPIQGQGTNVASVGDIQLRNASSIAFRNQGNSADLVAVGSDSSNNINLGNSTGNTTVTGNTNINLTVGAGSFNMTSGSLTSSGVNLIFATGNTSPTIKQNDNTTNSATAQNLTIAAQAATGTSATGGNLILQTGSGTSTNGAVITKLGSQQVLSTSINSSGITTLLDASQSFSIFQGNGSQSWYFISGTTIFESTAASFYDFSVNKVFDFNQNGVGASDMTIASAVTAYTIKQADISQVANGATLTLQAQNNTHASATGGNIVLKSGTGTSARGNASLIGNTIFFEATQIQMTDLAGPSTALTIDLAATGTTDIIAASGVTAFTIKQADLATNSGTGATLTVHAQNETGTTSTGGGLTLASGTGTSTSGTLTLNAGSGSNGQATLSDSNFIVNVSGAQAFGVNGSTFTVNVPAIQWATGITPVFSQADNITNSATGALMTIRAQNATGTTSNGAGLTLCSGSGTSTNGAITLKTGGASGTVRLTANGTGLGFYAATPVAQQTKIANYTDSTGGTPGTTLAAVTGSTYSSDIPTIRNWIASLNKQINDLKNQLSAAGSGVGITT